MPARIRPTIPHGEGYCHREHRSKKGREQFAKWRKAHREILDERYGQRLEEEKEREIRREIDELGEVGV